MAFRHGKSTRVFLDGADLSAYFNAADVSVDVDNADVTTFTASWKSYLAGVPSVKIEAKGFYDPAIITILEGLIGDAPGAILTVVPGGDDTVASAARIMRVAASTYAESAPVGGAVSFAASFFADGPVGFGHLLALGTFTADANGATHTGPVGGTTTGAVATLHVTSVSAGDTADVTVEDSANGSAWATIGTFAQKAAAGSERIVIAGTIRRYTRAVVNVTGASVSIPLVVALART